MFKIIDINKIKEIGLENLSSRFSKKTIEAIEILSSYENNLLIRENNKLLEYQNTNYENYQWILKDFIDEVNISSSLIISYIKEVIKNAKDIVFENPTILDHSIVYIQDTDTIESKTIKEHYINYLNLVNEFGLKASKFLKIYDFELYENFNEIMLFTPNAAKCMIDERGHLIKYTEENLFNYKIYQEKRAYIVLDYGVQIQNLINTHKNAIDLDTLEALEFFSCKDDSSRKFIANNPIYATNLSDEKIIPKGSQVYTYKWNNYEFDILTINSSSVKKRSISWNYSFKCSFDIAYYIKKYLIETYTKKDIFSFMCLYKDFLSNYDYINFRDKQDFNQNHPMIQEANLLSDIQDISIKFDKRLSSYTQILEDIKKSYPGTLSIVKYIEEWAELVKFPDSTKQYFYAKIGIGKELKLDDFKNELFNYANNIKKKEIDKILDNDLKKEMFLNIEKVRYFFDEVINNILSKLYYFESADNKNVNQDFSRFFNKRDSATFHTTLKESIVIDCRNKDNIIISEATSRILNNETIEKLNKVLLENKYHDYIEIDKDILGKDSVLTIDNIINLIEKVNNFNLPVNIKTALKFRKLKQYKANGIYFSFSKQLGLDFRDGFGAYMHETAHHIDLSTENHNRSRIVNYLYEYFKNRITQRADYYLKSEELIARGAEIALILLLGRYEKFKELYDKKEIDERILVRAVNETFLKTSHSSFMASLTSYKDEQYFDYEFAILNRDFKSIDYLLVYFKSFWSGKVVNSKDELRLPSNNNVSYNNDKKFVKKSELSYKYFFRSIFKDKIKF
ncbi:hypothetical protein [Aliarcobacter butzleri]|uniref:hypothetical protein n=1 Tax=Aliarcobacter butzleri TaxID=28197 RepID=UPI00126A29E4|nr:hypothetical protein [Aliarcobacter butzleri]